MFVFVQLFDLDVKNSVWINFDVFMFGYLSCEVDFVSVFDFVDVVVD